MKHSKLLLSISLFLLLSNSSAFGGAKVELLLGFFNLGSGNPSYPKAFSGMGQGAQVGYFFSNTSWGVLGTVMNQGSGQYLALKSRYYVSGGPQTTGPSPLETMKVESNARGVYAELGFGSYQLSNSASVISGTTTLTVTSQTSGWIGLASLGFEQPFIWGLTLDLHGTFIASGPGGALVNLVLFQLGIGIPLDL